MWKLSGAVIKELKLYTVLLYKSVAFTLQYCIQTPAPKSVFYLLQVQPVRRGITIETNQTK